jgi:predicted nucleic acid-binding Zn ribbon protein
LKEVREAGACRRCQAMPNYTFKCEACGDSELQRRPVEECNATFTCSCGGTRKRDLAADFATINVDTSGCRDHNVIAREKRVYRPGTRAQADRKEAAYAKHVKQRRSQLREDGNRGTIKQSHAIPADLYHGKIRETGDKQYWQDKKNVDRHKEFEVG